VSPDENEQEGTSGEEPAAPEAAVPASEPAAEAPAASDSEPVADAATATGEGAPIAEASATESPPVAEGAASAPSGFRPPSDRPQYDRPQGDRPQRRDGGGDGDDRGRRRHFGRRRVCMFCADKVTSIDYKDAMRLRRFLSDRARVEPRRKTGTCAKHQRWLATALKRARHLAMLPYTPEHIRLSGVTTGRQR